MSDKFLCVNCLKACNGNDELFISNPYCTGSTCRLLYELNRKASERNMKEHGATLLEEEGAELKVA